MVRRPGAKVSAHDIADWYRARLAPIRVPRYVMFLNALPHTPTHRVEKFKPKSHKTLKARAEDLAAPR